MCLCICASVCVCICVSLHLCICASVYLCICASVCLCICSLLAVYKVYMSVCMCFGVFELHCICLCVFVFVCLNYMSVCMHVCVFELYVCLYVCVHVYPYVGMSVCLCILCDVFNSCDKLSHRWSRGGIQLHHQSGDAENPLIFPHGSTGIICSDDHWQT